MSHSPYTNSPGDRACQVLRGALCKYYVLRKSYLDLPQYSWILFHIKAYCLATSTTIFGEIKSNSLHFCLKTYAEGKAGDEVQYLGGLLDGAKAYTEVYRM